MPCLIVIWSFENGCSMSTARPMFIVRQERENRFRNTLAAYGRRKTPCACLTRRGGPQGREPVDRANPLDRRQARREDQSCLGAGHGDGRARGFTRALPR